MRARSAAPGGTSCTAQRSLSLATRSGQDVLEHVTDVARVLLDRSLSWLGLVDHGRVEEGPVVRLSQAARAWLDEAGSPNEDAPDRDAEWLASTRLGCGPRCDVAAVIEAARYGSVWLDASRIGIELRPDTLARASDHDPDLAGLRTALSSLSGNVPAALEEAIREATLERPGFQVSGVDPAIPGGVRMVRFEMAQLGSISRPASITL